jgi:hypothetical protein
MVAPATTSALQTDDRRAATVHFWPIFAWLGLQMLALLAAGLRVPFSARFVVPEEQLAIHEMFTVQMIASALLFPTLLRNLPTAATAIAVTPLMVQLAGVIGAQSEWLPLTVACAYPTLWLIGLAMWASALRGSGKAQLYGVTAATLLVLGGVLVAYLGREFGSPGEPLDWAKRGWLGPLMAGFALLEAGVRTGTAWVFMGIHLLTAAVAAAIHHRLRSKRLKGPSILDQSPTSLPRLSVSPD